MRVKLTTSPTQTPDVVILVISCSKLCKQNNTRKHTHTHTPTPPHTYPTLPPHTPQKIIKKKKKNQARTKKHIKSAQPQNRITQEFAPLDTKVGPKFEVDQHCSSSSYTLSAE